MTVSDNEIVSITSNNCDLGLVIMITLSTINALLN